MGRKREIIARLLLIGVIVAMAYTVYRNYIVEFSSETQIKYFLKSSFYTKTAIIFEMIVPVFALICIIFGKHKILFVLILSFIIFMNVYVIGYCIYYNFNTVIPNYLIRVLYRIISNIAALMVSIASLICYPKNGLQKGAK